MAGDMNSFIDSTYIEDYNIYPKHKKFFTTVKRRTFLQPQFNKADKTVSECKDQIITTLRLLKRGTMTIDAKAANDKSLVPTSEHPFDHFMVVGQI